MDKKTVVAFVLIFVILILMPVYYKWVKPPQENESVPTELPMGIDRTIDSDPGNEPSSVSKKTSVAPGPIQENANAIVYEIESDLYRAKISTIGGGTIQSFILKNYERHVSGDTTLVELINTDMRKPLFLSYISIDGDSVNLNQNFDLIDASTAINQDKKFIVHDSETLRLTFGLRFANESRVTKTYTFYGNKYDIDLTTDMSQLQKYAATNFYELAWEGGLSYTEALTKDEIFYSKAYAYSGRELVTVNAKSGKRDNALFKGSTDWTALRTKYFAVVLLPETPALGYILSSHGIPLKGNDFRKIFAMHIRLPIEKPSNTKIFIGPLDHSEIKRLHPELDKIMTFGFRLIRPISKGILWTFIEMHKFIPNYGLVLIIFSILIKAALTPLTNRSTRSMLEMQKLQPKIQAIREKFPNDPKRVNEETMKLYKEHSVNPMGGCLPLLLQMPILFALFTIFRSTIELRQAPFIFWITDLSAPDTVFTLPFSIPIYGMHVNILPMIMAISTIVQQKLTASSSTNPQQKMMSYMMPIMFFFMFNQFPSGLNLYYTLFNILSVVQQKLLPPKPKSPKKGPSTFQMLREMQAKAKKIK